MTAGRVIVPKIYAYGSAGYWGFRAGCAAYASGDPTMPRYPDTSDAWEAAYEHAYAESAAGRVRRRVPSFRQMDNAAELARWKQAAS